ncbi:macB-like periplasmic core domain protein, partial [Vibrio parahaemolyticus V-223/04]
RRGSDFMSTVKLVASMCSHKRM